jgi:hypothetical protein
MYQTFKISEKQYLEIQEWEKSLLPKIHDVLRQQAQKNFERGDLTALIKVESEIKKSLRSGHAYYGAIGGGISYTFTPTGLGVIVEAKEYFTQETKDFTDYGDW